MLHLALWARLARWVLPLELTEAVTRYISDVTERGLFPRTLASYEAELDALTRFLARRRVKKVAAVTREHLIGYLGRLTSRGQPLAASTRNRKLIVLTGFFAYLVRSGAIRVSPVADIPWVRQPRREKPTLTELDVAKLIRAAECTETTWIQARDAALVSVLFNVGLRITEVLSLDVSQVDVKQALLVRVRRKGGGEQPLPLNSAALAALKRWLTVRADGTWDTPALFVSRHHRRLSRRNAEDRLRELGERAGFGFRVHPHLLRHSFVTELLRRGANLEVVRRLAGHARLSTTASYAHPDQTHLREAAEGLVPKTAAKQGD